MNSPISRGMTRATELTKSGKLAEATALIQSLLSKTPSESATPTDNDVIEGTYTRHGTFNRPKRAGRKGLAETLRNIAAGGMPKHSATADVPLNLPENAQFLAVTHLGAQGSRDYRLYVPANKPAGLMPLIVMLHGCTQSPEDFAAGTGMNALAEEFGCLIAWPAQPQGANVQKCWNWFRPEDQQKDQGEPSLIAGIVRDILRDHPVDSTRVYIAGLSAGGAAAAIMGSAYPEMFAAIGVHSGLAVGSARDVPSAFAAMRSGATGTTRAVGVPAIVFHGLADTTVHPANGKAVVAQALKSRRDLTQSSISGISGQGRSYRKIQHSAENGRTVAEHWEIEGAGHAWAGGYAAGSYTDPAGPDASREMVRFFLQHQSS